MTPPRTSLYGDRTRAAAAGALPRALRWMAAIVFGLAVLTPASAHAQGLIELPPTAAAPQSAAAALTPPAAADSFGGINPISILAGASEALPRSGVTATELSPAGASGASATKPAGLSAAINIVLVLTVIALVPTIMLMCTCFLRIVIVLGLLKQALGTGQMPPSQVMLGLSLILTLLVMSPTIDRIHREAVEPYRAGAVTSYDDLWNRAKAPVRDFMFDQIEATGNWSSLYSILNYRGVDTSDPARLTRADVDMVSLVPAFVLSELKTSFLMGFRVYLPFLVIDMVISALLISMSMMMLPPVTISLPFKLLLFVIVDGWQLICGSLMTSFVTHPVSPSNPASPTTPAAIDGAAPALSAIFHTLHQAFAAVYC
ncbi:hypothetical protein BH11PLA1_BH11PLA1_09850 [soil metagenome]